MEVKAQFAKGEKMEKKRCVNVILDFILEPEIK